MLIASTVVYTGVLVFGVFYFLQAPNAQWMGERAPYLYNSIYFTIAYFLYGWVTSMLASFNHCDQVNAGSSLLHGGLAAIVALVTTLLLGWVNALHAPFDEIFKDEWRGTVASHLFFLVLNMTLIGLVIRYTSTQNNCTLDDGSMDRELAEMDAFLNEEEPDDENVKMIEVKK